MKIAVDAMGGDHGPAVVVEGAVAAVREFGSSVILVGDREAIEHEIRRLGCQSLGLEIRHASEHDWAARDAEERRQRTCFALSDDDADAARAFGWKVLATSSSSA